MIKLNPVLAFLIVIKCVTSIPPPTTTTTTTPQTTTTASPWNVTVTLTSDILSTESSSDLSTQPQDDNSCASVCTKTYPLHTYPKADHLLACHRGCRFYMLIDLISDVNSANSTRNQCISVCSEAYNETEYNYPCSIGCNNQVPFQVKHDDGDDNVRVDGDANDGSQLFSSQDNFISSPHQFISNSFSMMKSFIDSIMNRGSVLVQRSSMAFYLTRNQETGESKLVIVQSEPEVVVHQYHPELMQNLNQNQNQQQNSGLSFDSEIENEVISDDKTTSDYQNPNSQGSLDVSLWTNENPLMAHQASGNQMNRFDDKVNVMSMSNERNPWVTCFGFGYQSGVPRWLLASVLFLAIFVLAWICCTTISTAPDQHIIQQQQRQVGNGSDLQYLKLYDEPVKMMINDKPPTYDELMIQHQQEQQAGPLPPKEPLELVVDQLNHNGSESRAIRINNHWEFVPIDDEEPLSKCDKVVCVDLDNDNDNDNNKVNTKSGENK